MDDLTSLVTPTVGATGVLTLVVLLVLGGRLVPRSVLDDTRADKDQQIAYWRTAYERSEEARQLHLEQTTTLLEFARTAAHVLESLPEAARGGEVNGQVVPEESSDTV